MLVERLDAERLVGHTTDHVVAELAAVAQHVGQLVGLGVLSDQHDTTAHASGAAESHDPGAEQLALDDRGQHDRGAGHEDPAAGEGDLQQHRDAGQGDDTEHHGVDQATELFDASGDVAGLVEALLREQQRPHRQRQRGDGSGMVELADARAVDVDRREHADGDGEQVREDHDVLQSADDAVGAGRGRVERRRGRVGLTSGQRWDQQLGRRGDRALDRRRSRAQWSVCSGSPLRPPRGGGRGYPLRVHVSPSLRSTVGFAQPRPRHLPLAQYEGSSSSRSGL